MSADSLRSTLKVDCQREQFACVARWNIPLAVGEKHKGFLIKYSKLTEYNIFHPEERMCTRNRYEWPQNNLEFFLLVKPDASGADLFTRMCYTQMNTNEDEYCESFDILKVDIYFQDGSIDVSRHVTPCINEDGSSTPILKDLESDFPKSKNTCVKWYKYGHRIQSVGKNARFLSCMEVLFEGWRKPSPRLTVTPSIPVSLVSPNSPILNTSDLLFSPNWSDVTIHCGVRQFSAHVLILQNASSVLRAMFSQPMAENLTRKLTIEDAEPEIVEEFLRYIYTGTVTDMAKNSLELLAVSEKYDVQNLKSLCENFILANILDENVLKYYNVGKLFNLEAITSKCIQEMRINRRSIWKTENEFVKASHKFPELFKEIFYN